MKVCFTGDVFLGGDLLNNNVGKTIQVKLFKESEKRVVNLEQPISNSDYIEDKCTLYTGSFAVKQLKKLQVNAVNLAHNHIQDKGLKGISETISHLKDDGIVSFGAGSNIKEASTPIDLTEEIAVFGYCEYDKPYLRQIEVAGEEKAGVNPLRYENILRDLNTLNSNQKAILYFHWGREHVSLPPRADLDLASKVLNDDRVLLIIGMHAHRPQGTVKFKNKKAYMCLGNFLFPNFYIAPPTQIVYPKTKTNVDITRQYLNVFKLTYKKWKWINRVSIVLQFDTVTKNVKEQIVIQDDDEPIVRELKGYKKQLVKCILSFYSLLYKLPLFLYTPIEKINSFTVRVKWRLGILFFQLKQLGFKEFFKMLKPMIKRKLYEK
jgi:poly-gamma-glutamate synthesis protein (capsule biosynthesis protein)